MRTSQDLAREIEKIRDALTWANQHFTSQAHADVASHMNTTVRPNPLTVSIGQALDDADRLIAELREEDTIAAATIRRGQA